MAGLTISTAWSETAITLAEAKTHLRIDGSEDDTYLNALISTAQFTAEKYTGRAITNQTLKLGLDGLPYADDNKYYPEGFFTAPDINRSLGYIVLPRPPLVSVTHFKYYDEDNTATTFATSNYHVDTQTEPGRLVLKRGKTFPSASDLRTANAYEITYVAGYGSSRDDVPTPIKQAIKLLVAHLFENREAVTDKSANGIPYTISGMLDPYKIKRLNSTLGG
tara:strand:+ start:1042 stop:1704 length:663 start_codon:yes stop_codon:yes gene_type:complete